ncbi:MAG: hypothetical protein AAGG01_17070, partial [Planctomycetota bacterium]
MLVLLQAVLGFDNLLYISLESKRAPEEDRARVRKLGIGLAIVLRIVLLFVLVNVVERTQNVFGEIHWKGYVDGEFTVHSLIVLFGGAFILYTAMKEILHMIALEESHAEEKEPSSANKVIAMIVIMNLVFSFDSILSAMAIANVEVANVVGASGEVLNTFTGTVVQCKADLIANPIAGAVGCEPGKDYQVWIMAIAILSSGVVMI